ncbi:RHS repeat-associated core domain-containing protein [Sphingobacterium cavernae]|uniref:RHS repeat-associated core domain-containing protein n=1 Tax=Sphingobacterium cavernae TaxID=2592657 RepID=UPI00123011EC|nr:RHS repeat-associated core domain-containing protein [Sphingobacterium cavernae]
MQFQLYDARLGRFLSPDNYVQDPFGTQNFNRYSYALNNPMVYVDPDGEFLFVPILVGIGVGILANGISNVVQDRSFFNGWVQAGIIGGVSGYLTGLSVVGTTISSAATKEFVTSYSFTMPATIGQQALGAAIGVASSYLPGINIPLGDNFSIGISTTLFYGRWWIGIGRQCRCWLQI